MKIHVAQKGESLWNIAKKYNVSFEELKSNNTHLSSPEAIYPGMKIKVPVEKVSIQRKIEESQIENSEEVDSLYRNAETTLPQNMFSGLLPNQAVSKPNVNEQEKSPFAIPVAPPPPIVNTNGTNTFQKKNTEQQSVQTNQPPPIYTTQDVQSQQLNNVQVQPEKVQGQLDYQQYGWYYAPQQSYQQDCGCNDQYQQYQYGYQPPQILPAPIPGYFQPYGNYMPYQQAYQTPYPQQYYQQYPSFQEPQVQPQQPLTPAYPFPTANFQGQGYPDYYRDATNSNFGVPPIDEDE